MIAQANSKKGKRQRIEDFLIPWDRTATRRRREQSTEEMLANLRLVHAHLVSREERRHEHDRDPPGPAGS